MFNVIYCLATRKKVCVMKGYFHRVDPIGSFGVKMPRSQCGQRLCSKKVYELRNHVLDMNTV